jgi:hypothetical protein
MRIELGGDGCWDLVSDGQHTARRERSTAFAALPAKRLRGDEKVRNQMTHRLPVSANLRQGEKTDCAKLHIRIAGYF